MGFSAVLSCGAVCHDNVFQNEIRQFDPASNLCSNSWINSGVNPLHSYLSYLRHEILESLGYVRGIMLYIMLNHISIIVSSTPLRDEKYIPN